MQFYRLFPSVWRREAAVINMFIIAEWKQCDSVRAAACCEEAVHTPSLNMHISSASLSFMSSSPQLSSGLQFTAAAAAAGVGFRGEAPKTCCTGCSPACSTQTTVRIQTAGCRRRHTSQPSGQNKCCLRVFTLFGFHFEFNSSLIPECSLCGSAA